MAHLAVNLTTNGFTMPIAMSFTTITVKLSKYYCFSCIDRELRTHGNQEIRAARVTYLKTKKNVKNCSRPSEACSIKSHHRNSRPYWQR